MAENNLKKNKKGYGYMYTDLSAIHEYLEANDMKYIQKIERIDGDDYIMTKRYIDKKWEDEWLQGSKVVDATLQGIKNPAQEQGSALTYARRYSLLMAFGLATEDDDGASLTRPIKTDSKEDKAKVLVKGDKVTEKEVNFLQMAVSEDRKPKMLKYFKVKSFEELTPQQYLEAVSILSKE